MTVDSGKINNIREKCKSVIKPGSIVCSGAGHDKGRFMLVLEIKDEYALTVDGKERRLQKPKRKNLKHLCPTLKFADLSDIRTDAAVRKLLWEYNYGENSRQEEYDCRRTM